MNEKGEKEIFLKYRLLITIFTCNCSTQSVSTASWVEVGSNWRVYTHILDSFTAGSNADKY